MPKTRTDIANHFVQYVVWLVSFAGAVALAILLRTAILAIMVRTTEAGYWGGVRVSLVDRVYLVSAALGLTGHLVVGEHYLRRGREKRTLARRSARVFGVEALLLGITLISLSAVSEVGALHLLGVAAALVLGIGLLLLSTRHR